MNHLLEYSPCEIIDAAKIFINANVEGLCLGTKNESKLKVSFIFLSFEETLLFPFQLIIGLSIFSSVQFLL